jgi:hypothetical protein
MHALDSGDQPLTPSLYSVVRVSPAVPDLVPVKVLKLRTSSMTRWCSERAPRAAVGEPSRTTTAVVRPQQEGAAAAASQALVPRDPHQGRGGGGLARRASPPEVTMRSRPLLVVIPSPGGAGRGGYPGKPTREVLVVWSDGCVMSKRPMHDTGASTSRACQHLMSPRRSWSRGYIAPGCRGLYLTRPSPSRRCGRSSARTTSPSTPP